MSITARYNKNLSEYEISLDGVPVAHLSDGYIHGEPRVSEYRREKFRRGAEIAFGEAFEGGALNDLEKELGTFSTMICETSTAKSKTLRALQRLGHIPNGDGVKVPFIHPDILGGVA